MAKNQNYLNGLSDQKCQKQQGYKIGPKRRNGQNSQNGKRGQNGKKGQNGKLARTAN